MSDQNGHNTSRWHMPEMRGIKCPYCGSPNLEVAYGRGGVAEYKRIRICRDCGKRFQTVERIVGKGGQGGD